MIESLVWIALILMIGRIAMLLIAAVSGRDLNIGGAGVNFPAKPSGGFERRSGRDRRQGSDRRNRHVELPGGPVRERT